MITLRPYQKDAVEKSVEFFRSNSKLRPILELPTASGKSLIIAYTVKELEGSVLILQPTMELLKQNYIKYTEAIEGNEDLDPPSVYSASVGIKQRARVTFATIGSIHQKPELFSDIQYVLIDECHMLPPKQDSMYVSFISALNKVKVLGLSATPYRLKTYNDPFSGKKISKINLLNRERPMFFNSFLYNITARRMYKEGYLCPIKYLPLKFDDTLLERNSTGAEFTDESIKRAIERNKIMRKIPDILEQAFKKGRRSALVFTQSVEESRLLSKKVPFSDYVHGKTPKKERARIIKAFQEGTIKTLFNVGVLTTGFDYPALDTIIIARPTRSLVLYMQIVGRGIRLSEGKEYCAVVDMCGNIDRFGKIEELRIECDPIKGWVLRNDRKIISAKSLDDL